MRRGDKDGWDTFAAYNEAIGRFKYYFQQAVGAPDNFLAAARIGLNQLEIAKSGSAGLSSVTTEPSFCP